LPLAQGDTTTMADGQKCTTLSAEHVAGDPQPAQATTLTWLYEFAE